MTTRAEASRPHTPSRGGSPEAPRDLVGIWHTAPGLGFPQINQSPALHFTYLDEGRSLSDLGMWDNGTASVTGMEDPEQVQVMRVTEGTFRALRLEPGVTLDQANADVARMLPMAVGKFPGGITLEILDSAQFGPGLRPLREDVVGEVGDVLWVLLGTVGMILLFTLAIAAAVALILGALLASYLPARRASRVDPMVAIRAE